MAEGHDAELSGMLTERQRVQGLAGGGVALAGIGLFIGVSVAALLALGGGSSVGQVVADPVVLSVLRFTILQAGLSTVLSVLLPFRWPGRWRGSRDFPDAPGFCG